jgi:hypothetical protein
MASPLTATRIHFKSPPNHLSALHLALPLIILLVAGCSVEPKYRPPQSRLQPFRNAPSIEARRAGVTAPPLDRWWEGFHDAELTCIVQRALAENLDLAAALTRVEQARAAAKEAGARLKPSGALTAQFYVVSPVLGERDSLFRMIGKIFHLAERDRWLDSDPARQR